MYWRVTAASVAPRHVVAGLAQRAALFHPPLPSWLLLKAQLLVEVLQRDGGVDLAMVDRSLEFLRKSRRPTAQPALSSRRPRADCGPCPPRAAVNWTRRRSRSCPPVCR